MMKNIIRTILLIVLCMCFGGETQAVQTESPKLLTSAKYYTTMQKDDKIRIMMFTMPGCTPCQKAKDTVIPALMNKYHGNKNVEIYYVDVTTDVSYMDKSIQKDIAGGCTMAPLFIVVYHDTAMFSSCGFSLAKKDLLIEEIDQTINEILY